jgi:hypothetical protein
MLRDMRRSYYNLFLEISHIGWAILLIIEAGFVSDSIHRKLSRYTADIVSWGFLILLPICVGETIGFPVTY